MVQRPQLFIEKVFLLFPPVQPNFPTPKEKRRKREGKAFTVYQCPRKVLLPWKLGPRYRAALFFWLPCSHLPSQHLQIAWLYNYIRWRVCDFKKKTNIFREYHLQRKHRKGHCTSSFYSLFSCSPLQDPFPLLTWDEITSGQDGGKFGSLGGWMVTI